MADIENHIDRILGESKECLTAWKQLYKAAVLETNMELVRRRVQEARKAAGERAMHLIREPADDDLELQDLVYASRVLDELNRKCQSARDSKPKWSSLRHSSGWLQQLDWERHRQTQRWPPMLDGYGLSSTRCRLSLVEDIFDLTQEF